MISFCWDVAKMVKARGFDPRIRRFESCRPSHSIDRVGPKHYEVEGCQ